jgi:hypothetical protein
MSSTFIEHITLNHISRDINKVLSMSKLKYFQDVHQKSRILLILRDNTNTVEFNHFHRFSIVQLYDGHTYSGSRENLLFLCTQKESTLYNRSVCPSVRPTVYTITLQRIIRF